ncbi:Glycoside hydrolase [Trema orientale]|uniref:Glycoside hydrolase n=1 Tax=Trema orientale TaxID=63057 RepID=A0A2P5G291_TREOI|nr:Glycoside hydrolase [Trema orientale]
MKNVLYKSISGTSASQVAIKFDCSSTFPCQGIVLQDIDLKLQGKEGEQEEAKAVCSKLMCRILERSPHNVIEKKGNVVLALPIGNTIQIMICMFFIHSRL